MGWAKLHWRSIGVALLVVVFFANALIVRERTPLASVSGTNDTQTWGNPDGSGFFATSNTVQDAPTTTATPSMGAQTAEYHFISPFSSSPHTQASADSASAGDDSGDDSLKQLLSLIAKPAAQLMTPNKGDQNADILSAYAYIPTQLISASSFTEPTRTPAQQALYDYGNQIGSSVQSYENTHANQAKILQDFASDRTDAAKIAAMKRLGADLAEVGDKIAATDPVPDKIQNAGADLAASYRDIGAKLALIPDANQSDASLVAAMETYNASAERFATKYVAVVNVFSASGVKFSNSDPGSVFMFPGQL